MRVYWWVLVLLDTDLPYLEPLLFHLRNDDVLKKYFTEHSYFMPKNNLASAAEEAMKKDCPAPRALWILPQDNLAINKDGVCLPKVHHTFYILIMVNCIRDQFQIIKRDGSVHLSGEYMEMTAVRKSVKRSVYNFNKSISQVVTSRSFENIMFKRDQMLYPDEDNFLVSNTEYQVTIF